MGKSTCSVVDCERTVKARGLCPFHYGRWQQGVPLDAPRKRMPGDPAPVCVQAGCNRPVAATGLCGMHYQRRVAGLDMDAPPRPVTLRGEPKPRCSVDGCERKYNGKGYCAMHSTRLAKYGDVNHPGRYVRSSTGSCSVDGCAEKHLAKGMCATHYARAWRGRPNLAEVLTCRRCGVDFPRPYKSNPRAVRFCSHECRYADQLDVSRADPARRAKIVAWRAKNPHQFRAHLMKRDGLKRAAESRVVTGRDLQRLLVRFEGLCAYCRTGKYEHWDHVVPLARGGRHAVGNLLPSCAPCNLAKGAKLLAEWRLLQPVPRRFRGRAARKTA